MRYWIKFAKEGMQKYISHRDMLRVMSRALKRGAIPVASSQGFNPHPLISFSSPLELGVESIAEYMDVHLTEEWETRMLCAALQQQLPKGFTVFEAFHVTNSIPRLMAWIEQGLYVVVMPEIADKVLIEAVNSIIEQPQLITVRENRRGVKHIDVRPWIHSLEVCGEHAIKACLQTGQNGNLKISQLLSIFEQFIEQDIELWDAKRLNLYGLVDGIYQTPWELINKF